MKIYVGRSETEECIKNKTKEFKQETHSAHWGINPPLKNTAPPPSFLPSPPPLNQQTVQAPPFLGNPPLYIGFSWPPLKSDLSVNPQNIKVYHP